MNSEKMDSEKRVSSESEVKWKIGDFEFENIIGKGSSSYIMSCVHKPTNEKYALKRISKCLLSMNYKSHLDFIIEEYRTLEILKQPKNQHPFIMKYFGMMQDNDYIYFIIEHIKGFELFNYLRMYTRFPEPIIKFFGSQIIHALVHLNKLNIMHRDLKLENIMVQEDGYIKIVDFGYSVCTKETQYSLCGTFEYMSPEMLIQKGYNHSTDWWSLGCILYEMLNGFTPFYDGDKSIMKQLILDEKYSIEDDKNCHHDIGSFAFKNFLIKLLEKNKTKRIVSHSKQSHKIFKHIWLKKINWEKLIKKKYESPIKEKIYIKQIVDYFGNLSIKEEEEKNKEIKKQFIKENGKDEFIKKIVACSTPFNN